MQETKPLLVIKLLPELKPLLEIIFLLESMLLLEIKSVRVAALPDLFRVAILAYFRNLEKKSSVALNVLIVLIVAS
jgi:hypothetical protein